MSNYYIEKVRERIKTLEETIANPNALEYFREQARISLKSAKMQLEILEKSDIDTIKNDMKAIMSHTKAVEEKYECRSVKGMFWLARFVSFFSKTLGQKIQNYTVKEIHAPVCSIVSSPRPELPPMPSYTTPEEQERILRKQREIEELRRLQTLTQEWMTYKPTRWELFKVWLSQVKEVFTIRKREPILSEYERLEQKQKAAIASRLKSK